MRIFLALLISCMVPTVQAEELPKALPSFAIGGVKYLAANDDSARASRFLKWGKRLGAGAHIRWTVLTAPQEDATRRNCRSLVSPSRLLERSGITLSVFKEEIRKAAGQWSAIADVSFEYVDDASRADVVIGAQAAPLAYAFADVSVRPTGTATDEIVRSAICLNPLKIWRLNGNTENSFSLQRVFSHEFGHVLGLDHPEKWNVTGLMSFTFIPGEVRANESEQAAIRLLYGASRKKTPSG